MNPSSLHMHRTHTRSVSARFSAAAPHYDAYARIQKKVVARLSRWFAGLPAPRTVLEIGCGSGQLTRGLLQYFGAAAIDAIDVAPHMVRVAREEFGERIHFQVSDAAAFTPEHPYDLMASSSSLHWMADLRAGFTNLARCLAPEGRLLFAVMLDGTLAELREVRLDVAPANPPQGRLPHAAQVLEAVEAAGLSILEIRRDRLTGLYDSARDFLRSIHQQGLTGGHVSRGRRPLTRGELDNLAQTYQSRYQDTAGRVTATYNVLYVRARQGAASRKVRGR